MRPTRRCKLILQFHGDSIDDYDAMVALENELTKVLGDSADVEGHDVGSGETNIFILTSDPEATFQRAKPVLERTERLRAVTAAYREVNASHYIVIWPMGKKEFTIA